jgi:hypothetical protein
MSKELFMAAHDELIDEYMEQHPNASWGEAYERTADRADARYRDKAADMVDRVRQRRKDDALFEAMWDAKMKKHGGEE